VVISLQ